MSDRKARIGLIGFGYLGSFVYKQIAERPDRGLETVFVYDIDQDRLSNLPRDLILEDLEAFNDRRPDLVVELAHPAITKKYGQMFLEATNYLTFSVTAFADLKVEQKLPELAEKNGTSLVIPHGAVVGLEAINEGLEIWEEVTVSMTKNPKNLDFTDAPQFHPTDINSKTVLYDGPTRGVCSMFPRNVNTHAALAMGSLGFDQTRSLLIADPEIDVSIIDIEARGQGVELKISRINPMAGVSGLYTLYSAFASVCRAASPGTGLQIR